MADIVKNLELTLLQPTKCKLKELDKLYSEYLFCSKEIFKFLQDNKGITQTILHNSTYKSCRNKFNLPSQLIIKARMIAWNRRKLCVKINKLPISFDLRCFKYGTTERGTPFFAFSGFTKHKRFVLPISKNKLFNRFEQHINRGWIFKSCQIVKRDKWILQVCIKRSYEVIDNGNRMGIDINSGNIALTIKDRKGITIKQFYVAQDIWHIRNKIDNRKSLIRGIFDTTFSNQSKRALKRLSKREYNFVRTRIFQVGNQIIKIAQQYNVTAIGIEDIKNMRIIKKKGNSKGRFVNKKINKLPYRKFRTALEIIAFSKVNIIPVNPFNTTKKCSRCGCINEVGTAREYICKSCGLKMNRDRNSSINICNILLERDNTISAKNSSSQLSSSPVVVNRQLLSNAT